MAPVLMVRKRDGSLQPFLAEKIRTGVGAALADRSVSPTAIDELIDSVEASAMDGPIESQEIGRLVLAGLRALDQVAYVRFASVYKDFTDAADFGKELAQLEISD